MRQQAQRYAPWAMLFLWTFLTALAVRGVLAWSTAGIWLEMAVAASVLIGREDRRR
jgi:hypothetical protein